MVQLIVCIMILVAVIIYDICLGLYFSNKKKNKSDDVDNNKSDDSKD